ncbi:hypothetical protein MMC28_004252 [Mycoblastus sanguinarius]|nr:hypothetical protein [Mycoblastus sanguinarius]
MDGDEDEFGEVDEEALLMAANAVSGDPPNLSLTSTSNETTTVTTFDDRYHVKQEKSFQDEDSKETLIAVSCIQTSSGNCIQNLTSDSPSLKPQTNTNDSPLTSIPSAVRKRKISEVDQTTSVPSNQPYRMTFGKHSGNLLDEVPAKYVGWMVDNDVHKDHEELAKALRARGDLPSSDPVILSRQARSTWRVPKFPDHDYFYESLTDELLWISNSDARRYFKVDSSQMEQAGIKSFVQGSKKWWLFQVHAFAEHFGTIGGRKETFQALQRFFKKNEDREKEIWCEMGLGAGLDCV